MKVTQTKVAALEGFKKDHKRTSDPVAGHPPRPVADRKVVTKTSLANLMTRLLIRKHHRGWNTEGTGWRPIKMGNRPWRD